MVNFFQKLGLGLKKTSAKIGGGISDIFTKRKVDAQTLEELEELLISADMGVKASATIIAAFADKRLDKEISEQEIKQALAEDIARLLKPCEAEFSESAYPLPITRYPAVDMEPGIIDSLPCWASTAPLRCTITIRPSTISSLAML